MTIVNSSPPSPLSVFARYWYIILGCGFAGALFGLFVFWIWPKTYEARATVRLTGQSGLAALSTPLDGMPGEWHTPSNITTSAQQVLYRFARDQVRLESDVLAQRNLFEPTVNLDNRQRLYETLDDISVVVSDPKKDTTDSYVTVRFLYPEGVKGAEFLNGFIERFIADAKATLLSDARQTLQSAKSAKERELKKLRQLRDISTQQEILKQDEALSVARNANIREPVNANFSNNRNRGMGVELSASTPLYLSGTTVLEAERKTLEDRIGNDLAIASYADLSASISDVDRRIDALASLEFNPFVLAQRALVSDRPKWPPRAIIVLFFCFTGLLAGALWALTRAEAISKR